MVVYWKQDFGNVTRYTSGGSVLEIVVVLVQLLSVYFLLCHNAKINLTDRWGCTPLHSSLLGGHLACAQLLVSFGGVILDPNHKDDLKLLSTPDAPSISDVWSKIEKINEMVLNTLLAKISQSQLFFHPCLW